MQEKLWWLGWGAVAAAGTAAVVGYGVLGRDAPVAELAQPQPLLAQPLIAQPSVAAPLNDPAPPVQAALQPSATAPDAAAESTQDAAEPEIAAPSLDVLRVAQDGGALLAGRALPGAALRILVGGALVAEARAEASGEFVAMFRLGPSADPQLLGLEMELADGRIIPAEELVVLAPRPASGGDAPLDGATAQTEGEIPGETSSPSPDAAEAVAVAAPVVELEPEAEVQPGSEVIALAEVVSAPAAEAAAEATGEILAEPAAEPAPEPAGEPGGDTLSETPAEPALAPEQLAALPEAFILEPSGAVRFADRAPRVDDAVSVDAISYSPRGDVHISGRTGPGRPDAALRIYLDNRPVALAQAEAGDWQLELPDVDPGVYVLRVDEVTVTGAVTSRAETPFLREAPEAVASLAAGSDAPAAGAALITVQPGHSLWRISHERYGDGARYVQIYRANRSQIRNPDLIYPGQVFTLPEQ